MRKPHTAEVARWWLGGAALGVVTMAAVLSVFDPVGGMLLIGVGASIGGGSIDRLTEALERLSEGDYDIEPPPDATDETGRLWEAMEGVASRLQNDEAERARRSALFEHTTTPMARVRTTEQPQVQEVNAWFASAFDTAVEAAVGNSLADWLGESERVAGLLDDVRRGEVVERKFQLPGDDGERRLRFIPIPPQNGGQPEECFVAFVDETDEQERTRGERMRQMLYDITSDASLSGDEKIRRLLECGCEWFDLDNGFLSDIDFEAGEYHVEQAVGDEFVDEGATIPLKQTFCRRGLTDDDILAIHDAVEEGYVDDPGYAESGIACYFGARVKVSGEPYGTFCFFDDEPTGRSFTHVDRSMLDLMGRWVSYELERREREGQLSAIVENTDNPIFIKDLDGVYQFANEATAEVFGLTTEAVVGKTDADLFSENSVPAVRAGDQQVIESGEVVSRETVTTVDGEERIWLDNKYPYHDVDGDIIGVMGISKDITERKRREQELERYERILESIDDIAFVIDEDWRLDYMNERFGEYIDGPAETVVGESVEELTGEYVVTKEEQTEFNTALERAFDEASPRAEPDRIELTVSFCGDERVFEYQFSPLVNDGSVTSVACIVRDVTLRKARECALTSLHDTARELLTVEQSDVIAERIVETGASILDSAAIALYRFDSEAGVFEPIAHTDGFEDPPIVEARPGDSALWNCFVSGESTAFNDPATVGTKWVGGDDVVGGLHVPVGNHGILVVVAEETINDAERRYIDTLAATTEAAYDRMESESELRQREVELEQRNAQLERQIRVTDFIREVDQSLIGSQSREEIEQTVCETLVETEDIVFAWFGETQNGVLEPRTWAGKDAGTAYLDAISTGADSDEPATVAETDHQPTVVDSIFERLPDQDWAEHATSAGFGSALAVPLLIEDHSHGVLAVYGAEPGTFADLERDVFAELATNITDSIESARARQALHAERYARLELVVADAETPMAQIAEETGQSVEYESVVTVSEEESQLFVETNVPPEAVETALEEVVSVSGYRQIDTGDSRDLYNLTVTVETLPEAITRAGGDPRWLRAEPTDLTVVVDVPSQTDVREFVDRLQARQGDVTLHSRREVERPTQTRGELVAALLSELTDRQREILQTAYFAGFFEWPRASTGEEVAAMLGVTQPTVNRHVRLGQQSLLDQLFGQEDSSTG